MSENLLEIAQILSRRFNPWWGGARPQVPSFRRRDFTYLKERMESGKIVTLIGPRQVGKTTLVKQLISDTLDAGVSAKRVLYVQLDDVQLRDLSPQPLQDVLKAYELHVLGESLDLAKEPVYLFLDEVQRAEKWAELIKNYYDNNKQLRFVCTGSASFTITQQSSETLPGRQLSFTMFPLKFADAAVAANQQALDVKSVKAWSDSLRAALMLAWEKNEPGVFLEQANRVMMDSQQTPLMPYFSTYLVRGGYPEIVLTSDEQKIQNLFKGYAYDVILKDLMPWFKVRDFETAEHLLYLLAASSGKELSYSEFSERLRGSTYATMRNYVSYFQQLSIITSLDPYSKSPLGSPKHPKVYFNDVGFRNAMVGLEKPQPQEIGILAEIVMQDHLQRLAFKLNSSTRKHLFYYKTGKAEVDFLLHSAKLNKCFPIECKYGQSPAKNQVELLNELAEENKTFSISTTPNNLAQRENRIEVPLWIMALLA